MIEPIETFEVDGLTVELHHDDDPGADSPRDWANATVIEVGDVRGYRQLGDEPLHPFDREELTGYVRDLFHGGAFAVAVGRAYDGRMGAMIDIYETLTHRPAAPFDDDYNVVVYVPADNVCGTPREYAAEVIREDVETYNQWLRGEVYGYVIRRGDDVLDSCWGYLGELDYCESVAREAAAAYAEDIRRENLMRGLSIFTPDAEVAA